MQKYDNLIVCNFLCCLGDKMAVKDAEEMIEEADQNGDGRIDYKGTCLRHQWPPTSTKWRHKQVLKEPRCHFFLEFIVFTRRWNRSKYDKINHWRFFFTSSDVIAYVKVMLIQCDPMGCIKWKINILFI